MRLSIHIHLSQKLEISGAISLLLLHDFMACVVTLPLFTSPSLLSGCLHLTREANGFSLNVIPEIIIRLIIKANEMHYFSNLLW